MKKIFLSTAILVTLVSLNVYAKNSTLTANQIQQVKLIKVPLIVPTYIPSNYKLEKIETVSSQLTGPGQGSNYSITYSDNAFNKFTIETTTGGVGDLPYKEVKQVKTKFGVTYLYKETNCLQSSWLEYNKNFYKIISGEDCGNKYKDDMHSNALSVAEAEKVMKSLTFIK